MRIKAHTKFRLVGVTFFMGFNELVPGRRSPMISNRAIVRASPGDVIEDIWEMDGVWIDGIQNLAPSHPLLEKTGDGSYRLDVATLRDEYECPVEIPGVLTIED